eukprot:4430298-Pleurochrysis_carterae.AAC.1
MCLSLMVITRLLLNESNDIAVHYFTYKAKGQWLSASRFCGCFERERDPKERVARDERAQRLFAPVFGVRRPLREYHVAHVGGGVVHAQLDVVRDQQAEGIAQQLARLPHGARAVRACLVPERRRAKHRGW